MHGGGSFMFYKTSNITILLFIITTWTLGSLGFAQDTPDNDYNVQDVSDPCTNLYFDLKKGTLNGLKPDAPMYLVKSKLPCFTGETEEGSDINYGGGVFYLNHDFYFYTHKDYIEVRRNFKGKLSADILGKSKSQVRLFLFGKLNEIEYADLPGTGHPYGNGINKLYFKNDVGVLIVKFYNNIASDVISKSADFKEQTLNTPPNIVITSPDLDRGMKKKSAKTLHVAGTVSDSDGIRSVEVNGIKADLRRAGSFSADIPLDSGNNTITVKATDNKFLSASKTFNYYNESLDFSGFASLLKNKRLALIVGNSEYQYGGSLANPVNDARAMQETLSSLGFDVIKRENCTQKALKMAMDEFGKRLDNYDVGLFFYAGHGVQVNGNNYLIPVDAKLDNEQDAEYDCVRADRILAKMESAGSKANIVILDACRNNPFERSWRRSGSGKGLAFMNAPSGSLIAYATAPGNTASDGSGKNGLYTSALLKHISAKGLTIEDVFKRVRKTVMEQSGNKQTPWESTSLTGDFYFQQ